MASFYKYMRSVGWGVLIAKFVSATLLWVLYWWLFGSGYHRSVNGSVCLGPLGCVAYLQVGLCIIWWLRFFWL